MLSVGSLGKRNQISPFRLEQGEFLRKNGVAVDYFNIPAGGFLGYAKAYPLLRKVIRGKKYDIIHAHYGLSGMICVLQRRIPVVVTFHGSDIWNPSIRPISLIVSYLSHWNIFVSQRLKVWARGFRKSQSSVIPCGVDRKIFFPMAQSKAREMMGLDRNGVYVLFSSSFGNRIKNYALAGKALSCFPHARLIELKGMERKEVNFLMNACDLLLVTSFQESGPLVVKEAILCNLPVVSTDVGDVRDVIANIPGCYIPTYDPEDVAEKIGLALAVGRIDGIGDRRKPWEADVVAEKINMIYDSLLEHGNRSRGLYENERPTSNVQRPTSNNDVAVLPKRFTKN